MTKNQKKTVVLVILDGFGHGMAGPYNAISVAKTPNFDLFWSNFPHALLNASGAAVGLLEGDIGNSEVGHLTLGAGRVVRQPVSIIHEAIETGDFYKNSQLISALDQLHKTGGRLHVFGLLSDASVHSHIKHLAAFLQTAKNHGIREIFIHPFLDGRDVAPKSAEKYLNELEKMIKQAGIGTIGSIHGRFYAMDRDNNWKRTEKSYKTLTGNTQNTAKNWRGVLEKNYAQNITDEFIAPTQLDPQAIVRNGDGIIFFNFRPDRARQLTKAFIDPSFNNFPTKKINLQFFISPVAYENGLPTTTLFKKEKIKDSLPDLLHKMGKRMFAIAETEKYAHVTYFFSGGREKALQTETRVLVPSIPAKNYINHPEMSAEQITRHVLHSLKTDPCDFYLINYANADMVGHSGDMAATVKAVECLDKQLGKLYEQVVENMNGILIVTADHGNAEKMFDEKTGQPQTAHTTSQVPFIVISAQTKGDRKNLPLTQLADVAPFILKFFS